MATDGLSSLPASRRFTFGLLLVSLPLFAFEEQKRFVLNLSLTG